jgi:DNA polymerase-3 subunit delta
MQEKRAHNIFFWWGNDDFSMQEILRAEKEAMKKSNPNADIGDFDFAFADNRFEMERQVRQALSSSSLFSSDKLTVIRGFWSAKRPADKDVGEEEGAAGANRKDDFESFLLEYLDRITPRDRIFFLESKSLDKRSRAFKRFENLRQDPRFEMREFALPLGFQFNVWLAERVARCGGKIGKAEVDFLALLLGRGKEQKEKGGRLVVAYDLYQASLEIDKLVTYCDGQPIRKEDILLLVSGADDMNIFNLIESLGRRDKNRALAILSGQLRQGINGNYILTMLVFHFRNLLSIKSLAGEGLGAGEISRRTNIHPFVVEKSIAYARSFREEDLVLVYQKLYGADLSIKTGKMEPELALDLLLAAI